MFNMFLKFIKIGLTAFGGGSVIISLVKKEFVDTGMIKGNDFVNALALSQATPGPIAGSLATFVGYKLFGTMGIFVAVLGVSLPTFLIVVIFSGLLKKYKDNNIVEGVFSILRPVVISLVISVLFYLLNISVFNNIKIPTMENIIANVNIKALIIFFIVLLPMFKYKVNPVYFISISAVLGAIIL